MAEIVLRGLLASLAARMGDSVAPSPTLPPEGEGVRAAGVPHG